VRSSGSISTRPTTLGFYSGNNELVLFDYRTGVAKPLKAMLQQLTVTGFFYE